MAPKGIALHARPAAGGASMTRERKALLLSVAAILVTPGIGAEEQTLRYRAEHLFTLPVEMSRAMLAFGGPKDWRHFPQHTRHIDVDGDGGHDFIAIALGAPGGYGAQVRYRLHRDPESGAVTLGDWYWSVITGPDRKRLYESFNP